MDIPIWKHLKEKDRFKETDEKEIKNTIDIIKPGVRGGRDQFEWDQVKEDKYRENYLGNSLMAPLGRWQKGKDLTWYSKDTNSRTDLSQEVKESIKNKLKDEEKGNRNKINEELDLIRQKEQAILKSALVHGFGSTAYTTAISQSELKSVVSGALQEEEKTDLMDKEFDHIEDEKRGLGYGSGLTIRNSKLLHPSSVTLKGTDMSDDENHNKRQQQPTRSKYSSKMTEDTRLDGVNASGRDEKHTSDSKHSTKYRNDLYFEREKRPRKSSVSVEEESYGHSTREREIHQKPHSIKRSFEKDHEESFPTDHRHDRTSPKGRDYGDNSFSSSSYLSNRDGRERYDNDNRSNRRSNRYEHEGQDKEKRTFKKSYRDYDNDSRDDNRKRYRRNDR